MIDNKLQKESRSNDNRVLVIKFFIARREEDIKEVKPLEAKKWPYYNAVTKIISGLLSIRHAIIQQQLEHDRFFSLATKHKN